MPRSKTFNQELVSDNVNKIAQSKSQFFSSEEEALRFALSILDLTTLEGSDHDTTIANLCNRAKSFETLGFPNVAAVCVYPVFVRQAKSLLSGTDIHVASVAGAFPSGQSPIHIKLAEIQYAIDEGADEIDMVISRGKFLQGDYLEVFDEIYSIREICSHVHLKVILETGEIGDLNAVNDASIIAMKAGADFIKTSTGKIAPAATPEVAYVMLQAIKQFHEKTGKVIGFKPAGGISTPEQALLYLKLVESIVGPKWLTKDLLRIGASRLATNIVERLNSIKS